MERFLLAIFKALSPFPKIQRFILRWYNTRFLVGVVGLITDQKSNVLLFHHTYRKSYAWGLPGGWLQRNEHPAEGLVREIREESSLEIEVTGPFEVYSMPEFPGVEIVLLAVVKKGSFTPSLEVDKMMTIGPGKIPVPMKESQRQIIELYFERHKRG